MHKRCKHLVISFFVLATVAFNVSASLVPYAISGELYHFEYNSEGEQIEVFNDISGICLISDIPEIHYGEPAGEPIQWLHFDIYHSTIYYKGIELIDNGSGTFSFYNTGNGTHDNPFMIGDMLTIWASGRGLVGNGESMYIEASNFFNEEGTPILFDEFSWILDGSTSSVPAEDFGGGELTLTRLESVPEPSLSVMFFSGFLGSIALLRFRKKRV